jgi:phycocyanobilin lyase alpha subunit
MQSNSEPAYTVEQAIANLQQQEDPSLRYYAAWWLGRFRVQEPVVLKALIEALEDEIDRSPDGGYPLRRNAARALGKLGDRQAVAPLMTCLASADFYVREAAAQSLGMLGDPSTIPALVKLMEGGVAAAVQVPGKPHLTQPYEAIIEALGKLQATEAIAMIEPFLDHSVLKIQYAAARALYQLTKKDFYAMKLVEALKGNNLQLRRSLLMDLGAIGYLPAAEAIAATLAENSLKLISLKGLLESELAANFAELELSDHSIKVMELMDQLL